ncbi:MAG: hypothetical protein MUC83_00145 [Pirellula sp.]|nr:hypothetical protein [Pirellula sp.]
MRRPFAYSIVGAVVFTGQFANYSLGQTNLALQPLVPKTQANPGLTPELPNMPQQTVAPIVHLGQENSFGMQRLPSPTPRDSSGQQQAIELAPLPKPVTQASSPSDMNSVPALAALPVVPMRKIVDESPTLKKTTVRTVAEMTGPPMEPSTLFVSSQTTRDFFEGTEFFSQQRRNLGPEGLSEWSPAGYAWQSPAFCYSPLYFEQINFERYGQGRSSPFAGASSAARFVGHTLILPISMLHNPPWCKECTLGHHRPGDCTPVQRMHKP